MANLNFDKEIVADPEHVARYLFSPEMFFNGRVTVEAFMPRPMPRNNKLEYEDYVSVTRCSFHAPDYQDACRIKRGGGSSVAGYAELYVEDVRALPPVGSITINVEAKYSERNPWHAGLRYLRSGLRFQKAENPREDILMATVELVQLSTFHEF